MDNLIGIEYFRSIGFDPDALAKKYGLESGRQLEQTPMIEKAKQWQKKYHYGHDEFNICSLLLSVMDSVNENEPKEVIEKKIIISMAMAKKISQKLRSYRHMFRDRK